MSFIMQVRSSQLTDSAQLSAVPSLPETSLYQVILRNGIWLLGIVTWLFGIVDRGYAIYRGEIEWAVGLVQGAVALILFAGWLYLKPGNSTRSDQGVAFQDHRASLAIHQPDHLTTVYNRMVELRPFHLIGREYLLPFPYLCQIYHLLNLKHLETIHSFSLSNLRVLSVSDYVPTETGGRLRFQTMLDSPFNILRLWRQGTVDVNLILHTPFTVELQVPVRAGKTINVVFNVLPLSQGEHKLFVDIYSNLAWPKPMLRFLLEVATSLTLLEDLPYLRRLTARKPQTLVRPCQGDEPGLDSSNTMQLYRRYVSLYAPTPGQLAESGPQPATLDQTPLPQ